MDKHDGRRSAALGRAAALGPRLAIVWRTASALARDPAHEMEEIVTHLCGGAK